MKGTGFVLAVESYVVRKGLASILLRIPGSFMLKEFTDSRGLEEYMNKHPSDILVAGVTVLERFLGIPPTFDPAMERTILVEEQTGPDGPAGGMEVIRLGDSRERILDLFQSLIDQHRSLTLSWPDSELTPRETTILKLVSMGLTNKQIAEKLFLSTHTVITHRKNISGKLGIKSVSGLTIYAIVNNIITIGEASAKGNR